MSYTIHPNVGETLANTRDPIRTNFEVIRDRFNDNHVNIDGGAGGGKHKFMQMPEQGGAPNTDPNEGALYTKEQNGETELFFKHENNGSEIQLTTASGFGLLRAVCNGNGRSTNGACTLNYQVGVTSVTRTGQGQYTVLFSTNAPTAFYAVAGWAMGTSISGVGVFRPDPDAVYTNSFRVNGFDFRVSNTSFNNIDPLNFQFVVFGG